MPSPNATAACQNLLGTKIDDGRLELVKKLGEGAYGVVFLAKDLARPGKFFAVKCLNNLSLDARQKKFMRRELALHALTASHPSIVTLLKVITTQAVVFVILEYCQGDLFSMITERQLYIGKDALIRDVFLQIVDAVAHCHSMGVVHRDLKPENILVNEGGKKVLLADFGLSTSEKVSFDFGCGSSFYMSPETQGGLFERISSYDTAPTDIWSLGVILINLVCGRNPWLVARLSDETFRRFEHNPDFLQTILPLSSHTLKILKAIFKLEPKERIQAGELRRMVVAMEGKSWLMSEEELMVAHPAARDAALASGLEQAKRAVEKLKLLEVEKQRRQEEARKIAFESMPITEPIDISPNQPIPARFAIPNFPRRHRFISDSFDSSSSPKGSRQGGHVIRNTASIDLSSPEPSPFNSARGVHRYHHSDSGSSFYAEDSEDGLSNISFIDIDSVPRRNDQNTVDPDATPRANATSRFGSPSPPRIKKIESSSSYAPSTPGPSTPSSPCVKPIDFPSVKPDLHGKGKRRGSDENELDALPTLGVRPAAHSRRPSFGKLELLFKRGAASGVTSPVLAKGKVFRVVNGDAPPHYNVPSF